MGLWRRCSTYLAKGCSPSRRSARRSTRAMITTSRSSRQRWWNTTWRCRSRRRTARASCASTARCSARVTCGCWWSWWTRLSTASTAPCLNRAACSQSASSVCSLCASFHSLIPLLGLRTRPDQTRPEQAHEARVDDELVVCRNDHVGHGERARLSLHEINYASRH